MPAEADVILNGRELVIAAFVQIGGIAVQPEDRIDRIVAEGIGREILGLQHDRHDIFHDAHRVLVIAPARLASGIGDHPKTSLCCASSWL